MEDVNLVRRKLGLNDYRAGVRNARVDSALARKTWQQGLPQRIASWKIFGKKIGIFFGVLAVLDRAAQFGEAATIMNNIGTRLQSCLTLRSARTPPQFQLGIGTSLLSAIRSWFSAGVCLSDVRRELSFSQ